VARRWTVDAQGGASRSRNTPWAGSELTGRVRHTILAGVATVLDGEATR
jgi:dihydroorotase